MADSDDDDLSLRPDTLAVLQQFLKEQSAQQETEQQGTDIGEDWNLSQFWYEPSTSQHVAETIAKEIEGEGKKRVLFLSTPSIFKAVHQDEALSKQLDYHLFEYDKRFGVFGDRFRFYDYRDPVGFPASYKQSFDYICFDPPFLSQECIEKVALSIEALSHASTRLLILTGRIQWPHINRLFANMRVCKFKPEHPRLQNDFFCCSNYDSEQLGREEEGVSNTASTSSSS
ncbi:hypothetical protein SAMD00019534_066760 [Acytostelium subglobosum LB1]|uniref:hypothetical protein n=1 Tax=Acytostelium subglobosum LB1 TaxID=1410327 RepID=UPI0006451022|nr:hypothetical protein SAMD00019534_066760 [Acytostelium subglobosum LB1]GAM23501.1 hypothetical protein SAMD00019534_066760 [Acytostelium subglobosum LB1]|eukprot:XP_012753242.1 hypothetical protein SAMD00019534_066760 [Acytostelium subglobosum LB1]